MGFLGNYVESQWALATFTVPPECACVCAFGTHNSVIGIHLKEIYHSYIYCFLPHLSFYCNFSCMYGRNVSQVRLHCGRQLQSTSIWRLPRRVRRRWLLTKGLPCVRVYIVTRQYTCKKTKFLVERNFLYVIIVQVIESPITWKVHKSES